MNTNFTRFFLFAGLCLAGSLQAEVTKLAEHGAARAFARNFERRLRSQALEAPEAVQQAVSTLIDSRYMPKVMKAWKASVQEARASRGPAAPNAGSEMLQVDTLAQNWLNQHGGGEAWKKVRSFKETDGSNWIVKFKRSGRGKHAGPSKMVLEVDPVQGTVVD